MKVVINVCYGGFGLSHEAMVRFAEIKGFDLQWTKSQFSLLDKTYYIGDPKNEKHFWYGDIDRSDPDLVQAVEELGEKANGEFADLKVVDIPDGIEYTIEEYDGTEWVAEKHRTWS